MEELLVDALPMPKSQAKEPWTSVETKQKFRDRADQWKKGGRSANLIVHALPQLVFRTWAFYLNKQTWKPPSWKSNRPPLWRHTLGPVSKHLTRKQRLEEIALTAATIAYHDSHNADWVRHASRKSAQLIDATLNNNSRTTAALIKQMKPYQPSR